MKKQQLITELFMVFPLKGDYTKELRDKHYRFRYNPCKCPGHETLRRALAEQGINLRAAQITWGTNSGHIHIGGEHFPVAIKQKFDFTTFNRPKKITFLITKPK